MTTSDSADSVLERVAKRNGGETLTFRALSEWLLSGDCLRSVEEASAWSILELATSDEDWSNYAVLSGERKGTQSRKGER